MNAIELTAKQALELSLRLRQHAAYWLLLAFADTHFGPQCQNLAFDLEVVDLDGIPHLHCAAVEAQSAEGQPLTPRDDDELEEALGHLTVVESVWDRGQLSPPLPEYLVVFPDP